MRLPVPPPRLKVKSLPAEFGTPDYDLSSSLNRPTKTEHSLFGTLSPDPAKFFVWQGNGPRRKLAETGAKREHEATPSAQRVDAYFFGAQFEPFAPAAHADGGVDRPGQPDLFRTQLWR